MIVLDTDFASVLAKAEIIGLIKKLLLQGSTRKLNNLLKIEMYTCYTYAPFF